MHRPGPVAFWPAPELLEVEAEVREYQEMFREVEGLALDGPESVVFLGLIREAHAEQHHV